MNKYQKILVRIMVTLFLLVIVLLNDKIEALIEIKWMVPVFVASMGIISILSIITNQIRK